LGFQRLPRESAPFDADQIVGFHKSLWICSLDTIAFRGHPKT
jgi:hypothetical protein